jgi:hypothetical protein
VRIAQSIAHIITSFAIFGPTAKRETHPINLTEHLLRLLMKLVEKLRALRDDIDAGMRSLEAGKGQELNMDDVISIARHRHGKKR